MGRSEQLMDAEEWEFSYRDEELACGEAIPKIPEDFGAPLATIEPRECRIYIRSAGYGSAQDGRALARLPAGRGELEPGEVEGGRHGAPHQRPCPFGPGALPGARGHRHVGLRLAAEAEPALHDLDAVG